jgi:hypothetical protein
MPTASVHKLIFVPSTAELEERLRKEARVGWHPTKFQVQSVKEGVLLVLEKERTERRRAS